MRRLVLMAIVGCVLGIHSTANAVDLDNVSSGAVVPGVWNSNFNACKKYADDNKTPLLLLWSNPGCPKCNKLKTACNTAEFKAWMAKKKIVMAVSEGDLTVKAFAKNSSGHFPYMRLYWPAGGADVRFSGRSGEMPVTSGSLQAQLMNSVDRYTSAWNPDNAGGGGSVEPTEPEPEPEVDPTTDGVVGKEWGKSRKLVGAATDEAGNVVGRVELKLGKASAKKTARISAKFMDFTGRQKSFKSVTVKVNTRTSFISSGAAGSVSAIIEGQSLSGKLVTATGTSCTISVANVGGSLGSGKGTFVLEDFPSTLGGMPIIGGEEYLPFAQTFDYSGNKMTFPRGATLTYNKAKGEFVLSRVGNPSSLKLSYKYPTGLFKGTFKAYIEVSAGRKRAYTANVAGLVVDGKGAGQVTVKGVSGTFPCRIDL